jgi:pyrimidine-nucleoside phosphorylase
VAACGGKVAKMSGRGLGFTGGTIDKLESIPNLETAISQSRFFEIVNQIGTCVIGQSAQIAPADKKLYALRDVTATVDSIPLIAASIMSKKLASGSDKIVLDVTVGSGAFMKEEKDAIELAERMVEIGENAGKETVAILTNMDVPLGIAVGNKIEVAEAVDTLQGKGPKDFEKICVEFAAYILYLGEIAPLETCRNLAKETLQSGKAFEKFVEMGKAQGGDEEYIRNMKQHVKKPWETEFRATQSGYITHMDTELCGKMAAMLGAGRETKESEIDPDAGILFYCKTGDYVEKGARLATFFGNDEKKVQYVLTQFSKIYTFGEERVEPKKEILGYVTKEGFTAV